MVHARRAARASAAPRRSSGSRGRRTAFSTSPGKRAPVRLPRPSALERSPQRARIGTGDDGRREPAASFRSRARRGRRRLAPLLRRRSRIAGRGSCQRHGIGLGWTPGRFPRESSRRGRFQGTPSVATASDGTSFQTWASTSIAVHRGLAGTPPSLLASPGGGTNARPNIAADPAWTGVGGSGAASGAQGRRERSLSESTPLRARPTGPQLQLPGSSTQYQGKPNASCVLDATIARREPLSGARHGGRVRRRNLRLSEARARGRRAARRVRSDPNARSRTGRRPLRPRLFRAGSRGGS